MADNARLLVRMIHLTRVACTKAPESDDGQAIPKSVLMMPDGEAWPALLEVIADNLESLLPAHVAPILGLLEDWRLGAMSSLASAGINPAGRIAYRLLEQPDYEYGLRKRVLEIIAWIPDADEGRFLDLIERASPDSKRHDAMSGEFGSLLTDGVHGIPACEKFPEKMARFTRSLCLMLEENHGGAPWLSTHAEYEFGLRARISFRFFPNSAFHGPFLALLQRSPDIGIRLILDIMNHAGEWYGKRKGRGYWSSLKTEPVPSITISVPGSGNVVQWADDALWQAYRGVSNVPNVIKCALMALEYWLLRVCETQDSMEPLLLRILRDSNSVMTTAVVASVCCAYPTLGGSAALALLKSMECIRLDRSRTAKEYQSADVAISWSDPLGRRYADERRESNALPHRRQDLRAIAIGLQFGEERERIWGIIDGHLANTPNTDRTDEDRELLLMLYGMDVRRMKSINAAPSPDGDNAEGKSGNAILAPDTDKMDADLLHFYNTGAEESKQASAATSLLNWGLGQWRSPGGEDAESWRQVLAAARGERQDIVSDFGRMLRHGPSVVAAVCVRDHWDGMGEDDRQWCTDLLVSEIGHDSYGHCLSPHMSANPTGEQHAAFILPSILARDPGNKTVLKAVVQAVTHGSAGVSTKAAEGIAEYLEPQHRSLTLRCAGTVAMLSNRLARYAQQHTLRGQHAVYAGRDMQDKLECVRKAAVDGRIDSEGEISKINIESPWGRNAAWCIMPMLGRALDLPLVADFFARIGQAVVNAWVAEHESRGGYDDLQFWIHVTDRLADVILALPSDKIPPCCKPFLAAVDEHPKDLAGFVETLVRHENMAPAETSFWAVWRAFAGRITDTSWSSNIRTSSSTGAALVDKMLFNIGGSDATGKWLPLVGHEADVNDFVTRLPASPPVLASYAHYLYSVGGSALPGALTVVRDILQSGCALEGSAVSYLTAILQRQVYGQPQSLKADPILRDATLAVLDRLVDAGSPAAYRMRDDLQHQMQVGL